MIRLIQYTWVTFIMLAMLSVTAASTYAEPNPTCGVRDAWVCVRAVMPAATPVLRPGWLPRRFPAVPVHIGVHNDRSIGTFYEVGYRSSKGDVLSFSLGGANSSTITSDRPVRVRGVMGHLVTTSGWPAIEVTWSECGRFYAVQARGVQRTELLRIVSSLTPVPIHATKHHQIAPSIASASSGRSRVHNLALTNFRVRARLSESG